MPDVKYCEYLFMAEPTERILDLKYAKKLYNAKIKALEKSDSLASLGSFVGIRDMTGKWICTNEKMKQVV